MRVSFISRDVYTYIFSLLFLFLVYSRTLFCYVNNVLVNLLFSLSIKYTLPPHLSLTSLLLSRKCTKSLSRLQTAAVTLQSSFFPNYSSCERTQNKEHYFRQFFPKHVRPMAAYD